MQRCIICNISLIRTPRVLSHRTKFMLRFICGASVMVQYGFGSLSHCFRIAFILPNTQAVETLDSVNPRNG